MKTPDEIMKGLKCCKDPCASDNPECPYVKEKSTECLNKLHCDSIDYMRQLQDENCALRTELMANHIGDGNKKVETKPWGQYWENICDLNARQEAKGRKKYGEPLEENTTLTTTQRIEHAQEEAIDLLKYLEHLKQVAEDGITANDYQRACLRTATSDKSEWLENAIYGIIGEAGEIVDLVKKHKWQGHELDSHEVALELGDLLWYGSLLASAIDYELGTVMQMNEEKLKKRYPEGFRKERSINREENKGVF